MNHNSEAPSGLYSGYENWKGWASCFSYTPDKADYFAGEASGLAISDAEVLEIGFGSGDFLQWARDCGARISGTEINPALLDAARDRGILVLDANIERIADDNTERFDTIVAFDVFEHFTLEEIVIRLRAVETMLKNGGHLVLRFPNAQSPFGLSAQHGDPTHISCLSQNVFEQLIQETTLRIIRYGRPFRSRGRKPSVILARLIRHALRDLISASLNFIYATRIPYDPVAVLVLRKDITSK